MSQEERFGRYILKGQIAIGGMAEIFKARYADPAMPQDDLVLKRILPSYAEDEGFITMFKDEGNIAIHLNHPNIVRIFDVDEVNGVWYIAMEFIRGTDLRVLGDACLKNNKRFTPTQVARVTAETAKALAYAHACTTADGKPLNIVHRDCTPHNIMVSVEGNVKLMDFGIAKAASRSTKTRVGTVKGKSSYMSPEQAKGKPLDGRSDMFTLATCAWESLTGYRLFKASSDFEILKKVMSGAIHHPSDIDDKVPRALGDIIMKALNRNRDDRYKDCGEFANVLEQWINTEGDGSDRQLGDFVRAMTGRDGHSPAEVPDYIPGASKYEYVADEFVSKGSTGSHSTSMPRANDPSSISQPYAAQGQQAAAAQNAPAQRIPVGFFIAYGVLLLGITACVTGALVLHSANTEAVPNFAPPEVSVKLVSDPDDATVTASGSSVPKEGHECKTTCNQRYKIGDTVEFKFEKEGYEPVVVKREITYDEQVIEVKLYTPKEAESIREMQLPEFVIQTTPEKQKVSVNGKFVGNSPITLHDQDFGTELNILVESDDEDYKPTSQLFVITNGGPKSTHITLEHANQQAEVAAPTTGTITVYAIPWGRVRLDGNTKNELANFKENKIAVFKTSAASHIITVENDLKKINKRVDVKPGGNLILTCDLNEQKCVEGKR